MSASVYVFDLRGLDKPTRTTPAKAGGHPRSLHSPIASQLKRLRAAREAGGIDRIVLHQWAAEVGLGWGERLLLASLGEGERDAAEARLLAYRAAGLAVNGEAKAVGGAAYHVSVGATSGGSGVVALVWPREEHTFHASEENARSVGVGVMGRFERDEEGRERPGLPDALAWALALAAGMVRGDDLDAHLDTLSSTPVPSAPGSDGWRMDGPPPLPSGSPVLLATHSQTDRKPADPGLFIIRHGVAPAAAAGLVRVAPGWSAWDGSPWPESWTRAVATARRPTP